MANLSEHIHSADWKSEKHVPVIECSDSVKADEFFDVKVGLGKEVAHPNTTEHHIRWVKLFFHPEGDPNPYEIAHFEFNSHGESVTGPNKGPVYTHHQAVATMKTSQAGTLHAMSFCNIHGVWESSKEVKVS